MIQIGPKFVFGCPRKIMPIVGAPKGKQRLRFRNTEFARIRVKTSTGIQEFALRDRGSVWSVEKEYRQGMNVR